MRVSVFGLWHLGTVTAACLAEHFTTIGIDPDPNRVAELNAGVAPLYEPGLDKLLRAGIDSQRLSFTSDVAGVAGCQVVWVAFDTPVDDDDVADHGYVERQIASLFPHIADGTVVLISSQVPVGFTHRVAENFHARYPEKAVGFAYSPENLRLGQAINVFCKPDRVVAGLSRAQDRPAIEALLAPFSSNLVWMSVTSAEMTKHALNAFLATSVAFINEVAVLCEAAGADCREVERGLKTEARIGPRAYLGAGAAFAGGTLARDINFLGTVGDQHGIQTPLLKSVGVSNNAHRGWAARKLVEELGELRGKKVAVLGLTYKPGTDTLRRSTAVELCKWLVERGALVKAYDPKVTALPPELSGILPLAASAVDAAKGADALVLGTPWPEFRETAAQAAEAMATPVVLDPASFLEEKLRNVRSLRYLTVGRPVAAR